MSERLRDVARRVIAELMTIAAAIGLDDVEPLILALEFHGDAIAVRSGARKLVLVRRPQQGEPIDRRIILRGGSKIRCDHGRQVQRLARLARDLRRIYQAVPAYPDVIMRLG